MKKALVIMLLIALISGCAQLNNPTTSSTTATISGKAIFYYCYGPFNGYEGAEVKAVKGGVIKATTLTDANGDYSLVVDEQGVYDIAIKYLRFEDVDYYINTVNAVFGIDNSGNDYSLKGWWVPDEANIVFTTTVSDAYADSVAASYGCTVTNKINMGGYYDVYVIDIPDTSYPLEISQTITAHPDVDYCERTIIYCGT